MLLPAFTDARQFLGRRALSYSEMSKLNHCDMQWNLIYNTEDRESYPASPQMELGTLMHSMLNTWWGHGTWDQFLDPTDTSYENHETASWLIDRYDTVYRDTKLKMLEVNVPFAVKYNGYWLFGWFDGIVQDENGDLWVAEFKTMGNWSKLHQLPKDKQVTLYIYAARRSGYDVKGVMFDALLTQRWKTEEGEVYKSGPKKGQPKGYHPPADSFDRRWIERTEEDLTDFLFEMDSTLAQRERLFWGDEVPIRNVGQGCSYCPVMPQCYGIDLELTPDSDDVTLDF